MENSTTKDETSSYLDMELLRFSTAGSVDDGKSTLIGRLLYDSKSIFADQYEAIEETSRRKGDETVNLALLTDGLRAEREQGITIDVAYRYFATPKRKFIIAEINTKWFCCSIFAFFYMFMKNFWIHRSCSN